jgi:heavy metal efflux system protein
MLSRLIDFALDYRLVVLMAVAVVVAAGLLVALRIPVDAFPDLTNNQVVVLTECPGMPPTEVEQLVTFPIKSALMGLPRTEDIRSISKLGLSMVTLVFDDSVETYFARQIVNERLAEARGRLPQGIEPRLGPIATAFGEVYQYTLEGSSLSLTDRKTLHDWDIKYQLRKLPGVKEVNTWGGLSRQLIIEVDPEALRRYGLDLHDVYDRLQENNTNFGGGFIERAGEQYTVLGVGRLQSPADLGSIGLFEQNGTPVLLRDVATVKEGALPRQGAVLRDARGETVSGMVLMLKGGDGREVIRRVKEQIASLKLPEDLRIVPFYDQSEVIDATIRTVRGNLMEAGLLVIAVLLILLGNLRAALIVAMVIPLSMLFGFIGMAAFGVTANLMSLGAIDFGMIVDGAVVMMENSVRRLSHHPEGSALATIRAAAHEVARPITFAVAIIIAVYLPVLSLQGLEGRMFRPMAITVCSALFGSLVLALTLVPVLASYAMRKGMREKRQHWFERVNAAYTQSLQAALRHRAWTLAAGIVPASVAIASLLYRHGIHAPAR